MSNVRGAEALLSLLKTKGGKVRVGNHEYKLTGKNCKQKQLEVSLATT